MRFGYAAVLLLIASTSFAAKPADAPTAMTMDRLDALIAEVGSGVERDDEFQIWRFTVDDVRLTVVADPEGDQIRVLAGVRMAKALSPALLTRLLQSNFDRARYARYAIAKGGLWATFVHPLSHLTDGQFFRGVDQTANLVKTFGTTFSGEDVAAPRAPAPRERAPAAQKPTVEEAI